MVTPRTLSKLQSIGKIGFFCTHEASAAGLQPRNLQQLIEEGHIERVARGLYRRLDIEPSEHYSTSAICALVPDAIVCLLSALSVHELTTQLPHQVWIALPHKAWKPSLPGHPLRLIRFSAASLQYGVEDIELDGVSTRITNPARTVVDCFRFRRLVGVDVAHEALRDALSQRKATPGEILRTAEACRAKSLLAPALEAYFH